MKIIAWVVFIGVLIFAALRILEHISLFLPTRAHQLHPLTYGIPYEELTIKTKDGLNLNAWFLNADAPTAGLVQAAPPLPPMKRLDKNPIVLFFHGNGGNISHRVQKMRYFIQMGASVLIFDYRGYGKSEGRPGELGTYRDGKAAAAEVLLRAGGASDRVFYYGESLGCAIALQTALDIPPRGLILDSAFTSTADMGALVFPWLPSRLLVKNRYDNAEKIGRLTVPLLMLHSPDDDIIPFAMGRSIFEAAPPSKQFIETTGDHNSGFLDSPQWGPSLREFLKENTP